MVTVTLDPQTMLMLMLKLLDLRGATLLMLFLSAVQVEASLGASALKSTFST